MGTHYYTSGINPEALRSAAYSALNTSTHTALGSVVASREIVVLIKITNTMDVAAIISYDSGTTDHDIVQSGESLVIDLAQNNMKLVEGNSVAAKLASSASSGSLYVSMYKR